MGSPAERDVHSPTTLIAEREPVANDSFLDAIGRPDLKEILTPQTPWVDYTMEMYLGKYGLVSAGGLGIVKGDTVLQTEKMELPFQVFTLFYPFRMVQQVDGNFHQQDIPTNPISPADLGFEWITATTIRGANGDEVGLDVYKIPHLPINVLYESNLQYQYPGENDTDHRLYQAAVLCFGGYKAQRELGLNPPIIQIDEAPTALVPLAEMDELCQKGYSFEEAKSLVKAKTLFTNHTLNSAAEPWFTRDQFERYVLTNITTEEIKEWIRAFIDERGGRLNLSAIAVELSGKLNGVSKVHAEAASRQIKRRDGAPAEFHPITNGISLERWVDPELLKLYKNSGVIDENGLPTEDYQEEIARLDILELKRIKDQARVRLKDHLRTRVDQYDNPVIIPEDAKIACWTKRIAGYKRPAMLFERPQQLADILERTNTHVILSGKAHPTDEPMKIELQNILHIVNADPILRQRVHFIQNYDEDMAKSLVAGVDISFNTPKVMDDAGNKINTEADGTFWKKAMAGLAILISTRDGGVADVDPLPCLEVKGRNYEEEVDSLYENLKIATSEIENPEKWEARVKGQLTSYIPIISGSRMVKDYLNSALPKSPTPA